MPSRQPENSLDLAVFATGGVRDALRDGRLSPSEIEVFKGELEASIPGASYETLSGEEEVHPCRCVFVFSS